MLLYAAQMQLKEWRGCSLLSEASCCCLLVCCKGGGKLPSLRFGQKHHQVTSGVKVWIHERQLTNFLSQAGGCIQLMVPQLQEFLGKPEPQCTAV